MTTKPIYLSPYDYHRLRSIIASPADRGLVRDLCRELDRAVVVPPHARVPNDVVTMDSRAVLEDLETGAESEVFLTLPERVGFRVDAVSVLEPLGTALLGCSRGDIVHICDESGTRRVRIRRVEQSRVAEAAAALAVT